MNFVSGALGLFAMSDLSEILLVADKQKPVIRLLLKQ